MTAFSILQNRICLLVAAFILDLLLGDPRGSWHPVQGIGWLITKTERLMQRLLGSELPPARTEETY
jgi:adenosylcobinamide-phosphate synthase